MMDQNDLKYYGEYTDIIANGKKRILSEINKILDSIAEDSEQFPVEHIRSRIKSHESMKEKLRKKGFSDDIKTGLKVLSDIIGVRIITHFIGDVYLIFELLKKSSYWEIVNVKDYISYPKANGYRSLHVILRIPVECSDFEFIMAEIQLRTVAMDCWASLEHQMKYKKNIKNTELIVSELKRCADEIASTDLSMQTIREMLQNNKEEDR